MSLVLLGAPYSGKGTQGEILAKKYDYFFLSAGDLIRQEVRNRTIFGNKVKSLIDKGMLVEDDIMNPIINKFFNEHKGAKGFVIDGFPRRISQIYVLSEITKKYNFRIEWYIYLHVPNPNLLARALIRAKSSNRPDDQEIEIHENRLKLYEEETAPVIDYYRSSKQFVYINSLGSINEVSANILNKIQ